MVYSLEAPRRGSAVGTQPVAVLAPCDLQGPGASAVSATGEADHEWEVEDFTAEIREAPALHLRALSQGRHMFLLQISYSQPHARSLVSGEPRCKSFPSLAGTSVQQYWLKSSCPPLKVHLQAQRCWQNSLLQMWG